MNILGWTEKASQEHLTFILHVTTNSNSKNIMSAFVIQFMSCIIRFIFTIL